jgi:peptidyl-prolyl cis-trans isomerase A (cyclophilin A)
MLNSKIIIIIVVIVMIIIISAGILLLSNEDTEGNGLMQDGNPIAVIDTSKGIIKIELFKDKVTNTCDNFIKLVNDGFYDGLIFHRISDDFMIQGGYMLPDGSTKTSPYGSIDLEINPEVRHVDGAISMARTNEPNSATSQFFICDGAQSFLDDNYAAFGVVVEGIDVVRDIADESHDNSSPAGGGKPLLDILINSIIIEN